MWLILGFLSAALLGLYDVCKKQSLRDNVVIPVLFLNTLFCSLIFLPFVVGSLAGWFSEDHVLYIPWQGWGVQRYILLKSCIVLSSWLCAYYGMKHLPLTIVGPINATRPVMVLVGAMIVFGERLYLLQWVGVALSVASFFLLSRSGKKEGIDFRHNRWILLIVLGAVLGAVSGLYDKYLMASPDAGGVGLDRMAVQSYYNFYQCGMMLVMLLLTSRSALITAVRRPSDRGAAMPAKAFAWRWSIPLISIFLSMADFAYFYALSMDGAMVSVVSLARRSSVVVSFLVAAFLFREKNLRSKAIDLLLVLLGMVFLYLGTVYKI